MSGIYQHIVNVSGGKDSDCCYLLAVRRNRPFRAMFADTGHEHEWTYEHIERLPERTGGPRVEVVKRDFSAAIARRRERIKNDWAAAGHPQSMIDRALAIMHPTGVPYLDMILAKGMFVTGMKKKFCTEELKIQPVDEQEVKPLIKSGVSVVQWLGIRGEESAKRAAYSKLEYGKPYPFVEKRGRHIFFRPLMDYTLEDVIALHRAHNLPMNPLYSEGFTRVGCFPCINERKGSIAIIARRFPEAIEKLREWEAICQQVWVGYARSSNNGIVPTFFPPDIVPGQKFAPIDDVVSWAMTSRGGRQYDFFAGVQDQGNYGCTGGMGWCEQ